jgi:hypothetical protein
MHTLARSITTTTNGTGDFWFAAIASVDSDHGCDDVTLHCFLEWSLNDLIDILSFLGPLDTVVTGS